MNNTFLDNTVKRINRQEEEHDCHNMAVRLGLGYADLQDFPLNIEILRMVPIETVKSRHYGVIGHLPQKVRMAVTHPEDEEVKRDLLRLAQDWKSDIETVVVSSSSMDELIATYEKLEKEAKEAEDAATEEAVRAAKNNYFNKIKTLDDLRKEIAVTNVTEVIEVIIAAAYNQGASDIHLEPAEEGLVVRLRIDGVLQKVLVLPIKFHNQILSRIKLMANIKLDLKSASQDGRFSMQDKGINADFRVSIVPTGYGGSVVMRILRQDMDTKSMKELGFSDYNLEIIERCMHRPYGLIVVTGPTGSGKSTTLYAILQKLNSVEKKILTLEDPIEYRLPGVQQSQIDPDRGFTFAEGLKGALRQDPDIVMVGEIRDPETATIALNASLTGHLVLSTLHTNDAVTAHTRFLELDVQPFLLNGSVQMIIAQRLVRRLVQGSDPKNPEYRGRLVIAEVLVPKQDFEQAVIRHADNATLQDIAVKGGMIPMVQDGLEKVKQGLTTEEEVYRVTTF